MTGQGLSASAPLCGEFRLVAIEEVSSSPNQARTTIDESRLEQLAETVRERGLLQPVRVRRNGSNWELIAGERRVRAARKLGYSHVPAIVVEANDSEALIDGLIENIQREDLNPLDRGLALRTLRVNLGLHSWEEVGRAVGLTRQHVHNFLNLTRLSPEIQQDIRVGGISEKHARALSRLRDDPERQLELWTKIHADNLSGDQAMAASRQSRHFGSNTNGRDARNSPPVTGLHLEVKTATETLLNLILRASPDDLSLVRVELLELRAWLDEVLKDQLRRHPSRNPVVDESMLPRRRRQFARVS